MLKNNSWHLTWGGPKYHYFFEMPLCCYFKNHQKKEFWQDWDSQEEIAGALDHSATMTFWDLELNNRIYNSNLKLATTPKELEIHHGNFLWVSDSLSLPLIQELLSDVYYQFSSKNWPLFSPWWVKKFFSKIFVKIFM